MVVQTLKPAVPMHALLHIGLGTVISGGSEGRLSCWDLNKAKEQRLTREHFKPIRCLVSTAAQTFFSASEDGIVRLWDIRLPQSVASFVEHISAVRGLCWKDQTMFSGSEDGSLCSWDIRSRALLSEFDAGEALNSLLIVDGVLLTGGDSITIWGAQGPHRVQFHSGRVTCLRMVTETLLCSTSWDGTFAVWSFSQL